MKYLMKYEWPGNVRELKNTIERSVLITDGDILTRSFSRVMSPTRYRTNLK